MASSRRPLRTSIFAGIHDAPGIFSAQSAAEAFQRPVRRRGQAWRAWRKLRGRRLRLQGFLRGRGMPAPAQRNRPWAGSVPQMMRTRKRASRGSSGADVRQSVELLFGLRQPLALHQCGRVKNDGGGVGPIDRLRRGGRDRALRLARLEQEADQVIARSKPRSVDRPEDRRGALRDVRPPGLAVPRRGCESARGRGRIARRTRAAGAGSGPSVAQARSQTPASRA